MNREELYNKVIDELNHNRIVMELWLQALENNNNDPVKAEEEYIEMRVAQLEQNKYDLAATRTGDDVVIQPPSYNESFGINREAELNNASQDLGPPGDAKHSSVSRRSRILGFAVLFLLALLTAALIYLVYLYLN